MYAARARLGGCGAAESLCLAQARESPRDPLLCDPGWGSSRLAVVVAEERGSASVGRRRTSR